jgi:hypothetical protein
MSTRSYGACPGRKFVDEPADGACLLLTSQVESEDDEKELEVELK